MIAYLIRRLLGAIPLLFGISTLIFFVVHLAPGDPTSLYFSEDSDPEIAELMRHNFGLDRPLPEQYGIWIFRFFRGEFGWSYGHHRPVADVLREAVPNTLLLSSVALVLIFVLGVATGMLSAVKHHSTLDKIITLVTFFFYSMPGFWFALMLLLLFSYQLGWFPSSHMRSMEFIYEGLTPLGRLADRLHHIALPAIALGLGSYATVARYTRASMLEVIRSDYVRTARAKGLPERTVLFRHALRNALLPVITLLGLHIPFLISGAVLIETIFGWPGMGRVIVTGIFQRDYPLIMASTFLAASMVVAGNLLADIAYGFVDPRIRHAGEEER